jgi:hypothetical protein
VSTWPYIIVELERQAHLVGRRDDVDPGGGGQFALGQDPAHVVVEDLGGGPRDGVDTGGSRSSHEELAQTQVRQLVAPLTISIGLNACRWMSGTGLL